MVRHLAQRFFDVEPDRPVIRPENAVDFLLDEATNAPELWHQKSYLARAVTHEPDGTLRDEGIMSLADFVDSTGPDAVAITVETDDTGSIHPCVYVRRRGRVDGDATLDPSPLHDYRTTAHRSQLQALVGGVLR
jgi:hypothetical protein